MRVCRVLMRMPVSFKVRRLVLLPPPVLLMSGAPAVPTTFDAQSSERAAASLQQTAVADGAALSIHLSQLARPRS